MIPLINKRETGVNLRRIMDKRGITPKDVQEYLGLGCVQSVYRWIDGVNMPTLDNLYALSELFQIPMDEMVRGNKESHVPSMSLEEMDSQVRRLYIYYEQLRKIQAA